MSGRSAVLRDASSALLEDDCCTPLLDTVAVLLEDDCCTPLLDTVAVLLDAEPDELDIFPAELEMRGGTEEDDCDDGRPVELEARGAEDDP